MSYFTLLWTSTGYTGAPGYTKLKFLQNDGTSPTTADVNAAAAAGRAFLTSTATAIPTGVSYAFVNPAQVFTNAGVLYNEVQCTATPPAVNGTGGANYPGGVGGVVYWNTNGINGGHRVRGRTYLVPFATTAFAGDGTLTSGLVTSIQTAANTFVATFPPPAVNSRKLGQADRTDSTFTVLSATVKDRSAFLRTRRT